VRLRAALETHLTKMGHLYDFSATSKDFKRRAGRLQTYARLLPDDFGVQMSATADIRLIEALRVEILSIEKAVMRHAKDFDRELLELLQTIPGLGPSVYSMKRMTSRASPTADTSSVTAGWLRERRQSRWSRASQKRQPVSQWMFSELNAFARRLVSRHGPRKAACMFSHKQGRSIFRIATERVPFNLEKFLVGTMRER
jgi:hypothetical protein